MSGSLKPDPTLVRLSAQEHLAAFQTMPAEATSGHLLGDREMEGQMRGFPDVCFHFGFTTAADAKVGANVAVGYLSKTGYRMRIYRKGPRGWSQHTFVLRLTAQQPRGGGKKHQRKSVAQQPVYAWCAHAPQSSSTAPTRRGKRGRRSGSQAT